MNNKNIGLVCCYFNPIHYKSKLVNFKKFYANIKQFDVDLLIVELAIGNDPFELNFQNVLKVRSDSIMWHKERLLNIGINTLLKQGYENIGYLDADIMFDINSNWVEKATRKLNTCSSVQLFNRATFDEKFFVPSATKCLQGDIKTNVNFLAGYGWIYKSTCLKQIQLYEYAVIGSGDVLNFYGVCGKIFRDRSSNIELHTSSSVYKNWYTKCCKIYKNRIDCIDNTINVLLHGTNKNRSYTTRHDILTNYNFSPLTDLKLNKYGCFEWASNKKEMHREIFNYFKNRKEDG